MIYGYARCSTNETKQDIQRQTRELKSAGAEGCEHVSGVVRAMLFERKPSLLVSLDCKGTAIVIRPPSVLL